MIKGIHLLLLAVGLFSFSAFSASKHDIILKVCGSIKGNVNDYDNPTKTEVDGKTCYRVGCRAEKGKRDGNYDLTVNYRNRCFSDAEITSVLLETGEFDPIDGDIDIVVRGDGDGDGTTTSTTTGPGGVSANMYYDGALVSKAYWRSKCIKRNGKRRKTKKCTRGNSFSSSSSVYVNAQDGGAIDGSVVYTTGGGSGSGYVILRRGDGTSFRCSYTRSPNECTGIEGTTVISINSSSNEDCVHCNRRRRGGSGVADILGAVLPPLAQFGSAWLWSDAYLGANQAWAGAAATGFEQCQMMQTNHMHTMYGNGTNPGYFAANELPHEYIAPPGCNGYQLGGFAGGMGFQGNGFGGFGSPWGGAGYSTGFQGGMYGPYGMYNPYGNVNGMGGGIGLNIGIGGGMGGMGYPGMGGGIGMNGGIGMGGMGYPGMGGGIGLNIGLGGGLGGGMGMGYPGMGGGIGVGTPGFNGGAGMGMGYPGYMGGQYGGGAGMYGNPYAGGSMGMGTVPWGNGTGSYFNGSGGFNNNGYGNYGNIQQSYALNQQALGMDSYYQQAALQNSYSQSAGNLYGSAYGQYGGYGANGGYGYAPYSPGNMGLGMTMGFGFGF